MAANSRDLKWRILIESNPQVLDDLTKKFKETQAAGKTLSDSMSIGFSVNVWDLAFEKIRAIPAAMIAVSERGMRVHQTLSAAERQLQTFSSSSAVAKERLNTLLPLMDNPAWEMQGLVKGTQSLDKLSNGALSGKRGLDMVADAAVETGNSFEALSIQVGNAYNALMTGAPAQGPLQSLAQMGVISAETKAQLEALQKAGESGPAVWAVLEQSLGSFTGGMDRLRNTSEGVEARLNNLFDQVLGRIAGAYLAESTAGTRELAAALDDLDTTALENFASQIGSLVASGKAAVAFLSNFSAEAIGVAKILGGIGLIAAASKFAELARRALDAVNAKVAFRIALYDTARAHGVSRAAVLEHLRTQELDTAASGRAAGARAVDTAALYTNTAATNANTAAKIANARASGAAAVSSALPVGSAAARGASSAAAGIPAATAQVGKLAGAWGAVRGAVLGVTRVVTALAGGKILAVIGVIYGLRTGWDYIKDRSETYFNNIERAQDKMIQHNNTLQSQVQTLESAAQLEKLRKDTEAQIHSLVVARGAASGNEKKIVEQLLAIAQGRLELLNREGETIVANNVALKTATAEEKRRTDEIAARAKYYRDNREQLEKSVNAMDYELADDPQKLAKLEQQNKELIKDYYAPGTDLQPEFIAFELARLKHNRKSIGSDDDIADGVRGEQIRKLEKVLANLQEIQRVRERMSGVARTAADQAFATEQLEEQLAIDNARLAGDEKRAQKLEDEARLKRDIRDIMAQTGLSEAKATAMAEERLEIARKQRLAEERRSHRAALEELLAQYAIDQARLGGNEKLAEQWEYELRLKKETLSIMERTGMAQQQAVQWAKRLIATEAARNAQQAAGTGTAAAAKSGVKTDASGKRLHYVDGQWIRPEDMTSEQRASTGTSSYVRDGAAAVGMNPGWMDTAEDRVQGRNAFARSQLPSLSATLNGQLNGLLPPPRPEAGTSQPGAAGSQGAGTGEKITQAAEGAAAKLDIAEEKTAAAITLLGSTLSGRFDAIARELAQLNARVQDLHNN